ncbi:MAG: YdcF family protein, partial [Candidatus Omnitrophica bacterium]|nr:YdcF family protein [Candidatus Omnitrophota bacterium]
MLEEVLKRFWMTVAGVLCFLFILFLFRVPIFKAMGAFLLVQDDIKKADVIVVLGGDRERVTEAVRLYQSGFAPYIIMTGGSSEPETASMAERMKGEASRLGVPENKIIVEPKSMHTY